MPIRRRHRRHRVADKTHRVVEDEPRVRMTAAGPGYLGVAVMNHRLDARQFLGFRGIDADDLRVRVRAAQHARVEHAGKLDVAGVLRLPGDALVGVDARNSFADNGKFFLCLCHDDLLLARLGGGGEHRRDLTVVVAAAAKIAGQRPPRLRLRGFGIFHQQRLARHDLTRTCRSRIAARRVR